MVTQQPAVGKQTVACPVESDFTERTSFEYMQDNICWHEESIGSSDFFVRVDLSKMGMEGRFEQLWIRKTSDSTGIVASIPFFSYGIQLEDVIEFDHDATYTKTIQRLAFFVSRIAIESSHPFLAMIADQLESFLQQSGLLFEKYKPSYFSMASPNRLRLKEAHRHIVEIFGATGIEFEFTE